MIRQRNSLIRVIHASCLLAIALPQQRAHQALAADAPEARAHAQDLPQTTAKQAGMAPEKIEQAMRLIEQAVEKDSIRGAVVLVARKGKVVAHRAFGWRDKEAGKKMTIDTLFRMASNTKPVISAGVLQLAEEGKLKLDDNVRKHIRSFDNYRSGYITIRHLLSHTSGLRIPGIFVKPLTLKSDKFPTAPSLAIEVDRFGKLGADVPSGTSYSYNNPGFQTLGRLIEVTSKEELTLYLKNHIYQPLGMNTSWNYEAHAPQERMAKVYRRKNNKWETVWTPGDGPDWPIPRASGGMISTTTDYAVFCQMMLNNGTYQGKRILSAGSVAAATSDQVAKITGKDDLRHYGLGWVVDQNGGFGHSGSDGTYAWLDKKRQLILLIFTQTQGGTSQRLAFRNLMYEACDSMNKKADNEQARPRLQDLGISVGTFPRGPRNAITDVEGVCVGHTTMIADEDLRTGVTAILPYRGNIFQGKVPAGFHVANGFGKFVGGTQVNELGVIETPIILTNTLSTFTAADALVKWTVGLAGNESVQSVNPVVGECNDGYLNSIRNQRVGANDVFAAIKSAATDTVVEGCVGAGTGTRCLGFKGGIGTASRKLPKSLGGFTVGVLVQTNFGGDLTVAGAPVGRKLKKNLFQKHLVAQEHGSCIVVVATDAPLDSRRLQRVARRAPLGLARVGSPITHGSGDYVLAFSTNKELRSNYQVENRQQLESTPILRDDALSPIFQAVVEATEEAVLNSLLQATTMSGRNGHRSEAIDPAEVLRICREHGVETNSSPPSDGM